MNSMTTQPFLEATKVGTWNEEGYQFKSKFYNKTTTHSFMSVLTIEMEP